MRVLSQGAFSLLQMFYGHSISTEMIQFIGECASIPAGHLSRSHFERHRPPVISGVASSIIGGLVFIYSCSASFISFEIDFFTVCEHEYIPLPIIELATPLPVTFIITTNVYKTKKHVYLGSQCCSKVASARQDWPDG